MTGAIGAMPTMGRLLVTSRLATNRKPFASLLALAAWLLLGLASAHVGNTVTKVTLVMTDTQGNVLMTKDTQGHILARYTYRPYGTQQSGPTNKGPGYTGHVNDSATRLVYSKRSTNPKLTLRPDSWLNPGHGHATATTPRSH